VELARSVVPPGDLSPDLRRSEGLEGHSGGPPVLHQSIRVGADQVAEQTADPDHDRDCDCDCDCDCDAAGPM
jgi:hypothetical protein